MCLAADLGATGKGKLGTQMPADIGRTIKRRLL